MNNDQAMRTLSALGNPPRASDYPGGIVRMLLPLLEVNLITHLDPK